MTYRYATIVAVLTCLALTAAASAQMPPMGGPMQHLGVSLVSNELHVEMPIADGDRLVLQDHGETYAAPMDVLNDSAFNAQFGWLANGFINIGPNEGIFVELLSQTPGLRTYEGVMMAATFEPIFTTDGAPAVWQWAGVMTHNWYAVTDYGLYEAEYLVYVGDLAGTPLSQYTPTSVMLRWIYPAPADFDIDGDVDLGDFAEFALCFGGANQPPAGACPGGVNADFDGDGDVDLGDFAEFSLLFTGAQ